MTTTDRRDAMIVAVHGPDGFAKLRVIVQTHADAGTAGEVLLEDLDTVRDLVSEEDEDRVRDVMDLIVGYCTPGARIVFPLRPHPERPIVDASE